MERGGGRGKGITMYVREGVPAVEFHDNLASPVVIDVLKFPNVSCITRPSKSKQRTVAWTVFHGSDK
jgi:hypothetical protein